VRNVTREVKRIEKKIVKTAKEMKDTAWSGPGKVTSQAANIFKQTTQLRDAHTKLCTVERRRAVRRQRDFVRSQAGFTAAMLCLVEATELYSQSSWNLASVPCEQALNKLQAASADVADELGYLTEGTAYAHDQSVDSLIAKLHGHRSVPIAEYARESHACSKTILDEAKFSELASFPPMTALLVAVPTALYLDSEEGPACLCRSPRH